MSNAALTHKDIGRRIAQLRSLKGLTQAELAKVLSMSRSSLTQLELGNRKLDAVELSTIMQRFNLSADDFLFRDIEGLSVDEAKKSPVRQDPRADRELRVSAPNFQLEKMRSVLLCLAEETAGKPEVDERFLGFLLYFTDFDHYERYESQVTGAKYIKRSTGPSALEFEPVLAKLVEDKLLMRINAETDDGIRFKYIPLKEPDLRHLSATEKYMIENVAKRFKEWRFEKISDFVKGDMPYLASDLNTTIDYNLAFYREDDYTRRKYNEDEREEIKI